MRIRPDLSGTALQDNATTRCLAAPVASSRRSVIPTCDTAANPETAPDLVSMPPKTRRGRGRSIAARRAPFRGDAGGTSVRTKANRSSRCWQSEAAGTWRRHGFHLFGLISLFLSALGERWAPAAWFRGGRKAWGLARSLSALGPGAGKHLAPARIIPSSFAFFTLQVFIGSSLPSPSSPG